ncbi:hypothetical protein NESM_000166200 [Novymonas esmeraldas]|uniref:Uncharacterized protein n=1 Tax=Novymonas esmeraldas TaxID=1808958 RepID=A0AAW0F3A8_9TRYP
MPVSSTACADSRTSCTTSPSGPRKKRSSAVRVPVADLLGWGWKCSVTGATVTAAPSPPPLSGAITPWLGEMEKQEEREWEASCANVAGAAPAESRIMACQTQLCSLVLRRKSGVLLVPFTGASRSVNDDGSCSWPRLAYAHTGTTTGSPLSARTTSSVA